MLEVDGSEESSDNVWYEWCEYVLLIRGKVGSGENEESRKRRIGEW